MRKILTGIYAAMKRAHGPRGWWPVFRRGAGSEARPAYDPDRKRLTERQRVEIAVGAILTQNTAWTNVSKAMMELHRRGVLSVPGLRRIPCSRLARLIRSSGYFNQKAKKLKAFVRFLRDHAPAPSVKRSIHDRSGYDAIHGIGSNPMTSMMRWKTALARERLLSVHGIGPETADSILLYALEQPVFVVDAYTRRIFSRHGFLSGAEPYDEIRAWFESNLPRRAPLWNDYHAQIVEIGKRSCHRRRPECRSCPLFRREFFESEEDFELAGSPAGA
ncbi:MAG: hypothetical protein A3G34_00380 [Candidatus Lindowbacteria bacterium RIFCSPLOWO2_12_FULL_62_27]|nr:MAG: hypothetical protein A3G34_00380 [Candidatus Lindowbacteria bacterium RIFCSPLOWO2_12_FULL_62_27]OGH63405.1 MAG: hypothetical protein A3I06_08460 [Candidatus Lindowbacteria bacterium RIFCSPLOWO2_02_FULL_62_12]